MIRYIALLLIIAGCTADDGPRGADTDDEYAQVVARIEEFPGFRQVGVNVTEVDIDGDWALATVEPREPVADGASVLLKRERGNWKVLDYGSTLYGLGKEYNVPKRLIEKWDL